MRNFVDAWQNLIDAKGHYLNGRVTFYEAGSTTSKKTIYAADGKTPLPNPIYTAAFGKTMNQVFLDDSDYTITFEMYQGQGNMESDDNESSWFNYKTILSKNGSLKIEDSRSNVPAVTGISALKNVVAEDGDIIQVFGYNTKEDCPPRYFVWHAGMNANKDDGGIFISSNKTTVGCWQMIVEGTYIDVRWYGDIPATSTTGTTSNLGQRAKAATAANLYRKDLYFPSNGTGLSCYVFDGSNTVSVTKDIICDNGVRFVVKPGTTGTKVSCHELKKCEKYLFVSPSSDVAIGGYSLSCDWINTSWFNSNQVNAEGAKVGYVIDLLNSALNFANTKIKFERDGLNKENVRFDNCEFVDCLENIDKPTIFANMEIKQSWFYKSFDFITKCAYGSCTILLRNFKNADTYIKMKNKCYQYDYGDLGEQSLNNALVYPGGTIENCYGSVSFPTSTSGEYEMHNCSLTFNSSSTNVSLNLVDCWITLPGDRIYVNISIRRGALIGGSLQSIGRVYLENVENSSVLKFEAATSAELRNCKISGNVIGRKLSVYDSHVTNNAKITQYDNVGVLVPTIIGNTFEIGSYYEPIALTTGTKVAGGRINHNIGTDRTKHWIKLNRTNFTQQEYLHDYQYIGNVEPYMTATNDVSHYMKKYNYDAGKKAIGTKAPWIETPGKGYNAGGDPQWLSLYNYEFIKLRCFSFGLIPQCEVILNYTQSLIYVSDSYRHPYYTYVLRDGLKALDAAGATDSTYEFVLGGGTSYDGYKYVQFGCDIYGHTGDDSYPKGYFYATLKFNIDRKQSTGINDRRKDWTV